MAEAKLPRRRSAKYWKLLCVKLRPMDACLKFLGEREGIAFIRAHSVIATGNLIRDHGNQQSAFFAMCGCECGKCDGCDGCGA